MNSRKFLAYGEFLQEQIDLLVQELKSMGLNENDIEKVGEHCKMFYLNPLYIVKDEKIELEKSNLIKK